VVLWIALVATAFALAAPAAASPPSSADSGAIVPTSGVQALATFGSTTYVGGVFYGGGRLGAAGAFDASTGGLTAGPAIAGGTVFASLPDGAGGWYVAGDFDRAGGSVRYGLAHIRPDGSADPAFPQIGHEPLSVFNTNEFADALALSADGHTLYVGGEFDQLGGAARNGLGAIDLSSGTATSWNPGTDGVVYALAAGSGSSAGFVFAGGNFTKAGANNVTVPNAAKISASTGNADAGFAPTPESSGDPTSAYVYALALGNGGSPLYIGGSFDSFGGTARNNLGRVAVSDGSVGTWNPNVDGTVSAVRVVPGGGTVYAGGGFSHVLGVARSSLAAIDSSSGTASVDSWDPAPDSTVNALEFDGSALAVGGQFQHIGGQARSNVAEVALSDGAANGFAPNLAAGNITAVAVGSGRILAGGTSMSVAGAQRHGLAAVDADGHLTPFDANLGATPLALALSPDGRTIYAGGSFSTVNGQPRHGLAAFDTATGALLPWTSGVTAGFVDALTVSPDGGTLYVGGEFTAMGSNNLPRSGIGAVSTADGTATAWDPSVSGGFKQVASMALTPDGGTLYIGGSFLSAGHNGAIRHHIAAISTAMPGDATGWAPNLAGTSSPQALAIALGADGTVYVGGEFGTAGANLALRHNLAAISPAAPGNATGWDPSVTTTDSGNAALVDALAIAPDNATLFAGGRFDSAGGQPRQDLAELSLASGAATGWNPDPGPYFGRVQALAFSGATLHAGGFFTRIGNDPVQDYAQFTSPPAGGSAKISGTVRYARTLTCSQSFANFPTSVSFQWNRAGTPIAGATGSTYKVVGADTGQALTCAVVARNAGGAGTALSAAVTPPPEITSFKISTSHVKRHLLASLAKRHKKRKPKGATFTFSITEKATATIKIERRSRGVKVGKKCLAHRPKRSRGKHLKSCTLYKTIGSLKVRAKAGKTTVKIPKRVGHARVAIGPYRAEISAKDSGGRKSNTRRVSFKVSR
jgi:hypothetical protein